MILAAAGSSWLSALVASLSASDSLLLLLRLLSDLLLLLLLSSAEVSSLGALLFCKAAARVLGPFLAVTVPCSRQGKRSKSAKKQRIHVQDVFVLKLDPFTKRTRYLRDKTALGA